MQILYQHLSQRVTVGVVHPVGLDEEQYGFKEWRQRSVIGGLAADQGPALGKMETRIGSVLYVCFKPLAKAECLPKTNA